MPDKVHIFWDNSNIFIPARFVATKREKGFADTAVRIQFDNLVKLPARVASCAVRCA